MSSTRSGGAPDEGATGYWTTETLPLSVRKQLLERELKQLGLRKAGPGGATRDTGAGTTPQQKSQETDESHPQAGPEGRGD